MTDWTPAPDAWRDWFPAQTCPGCGQEHPGQPCPEQEPLPARDAMGEPEPRSGSARGGDRVKALARGDKPGVLRYDLGIPGERANAPQGLTHSPDLTRKGLAMHATRELSTRRRVASDPHPDLAEAVTVSRFWRLVSIGTNDQCWPWQGDLDGQGYGVFSYHGRRRGAHELALSFSTGESRHPGLETCHACDNRACCNPTHLRFDTRASNVHDMHERGRANTPSKLGADQVRMIRERRALGARQQDLADEFGVSNGLISMIVRGIRWPSVGGPIQPERTRNHG